VAVISSGTQPDQETRIGTLNDIAGKISSLRPPALIVIGSVVSFNFLASQQLERLFISPGNSGWSKKTE
jgi:siroheme synthase